MNSHYLPYRETHSLEINRYLLFYIYVFTILIIANVLPVSQITYFLFLFSGILRIGILLIKFTYRITIKENALTLFIKIPFKVRFLNLKIEDIKNVEKTTNNSPGNFEESIKKSAIIYFFG